MTFSLKLCDFSAGILCGKTWNNCYYFYFVVSLSSHELQSIHKPTVAHTEAHKDTINHMEFIVEE